MFLKNDGVRTSTASAPRCAARLQAAIVALVDSAPVPAMSGRVAGIADRAAAITRSDSPSSSSTASPLEPSTTSPVSRVCM